MKISVSYLGCKNIKDTLKLLDKTDCDFIHCDVMDNKYVKNKSISFKDLYNATKYTTKRMDVHLMVEKPIKYIDSYASLNAEYITIHLDIKNDIDKTIDLIKMYGIKVGLALNPNQDIGLLKPYLDKIDLILIMTVVPGKSGQELIDESSNKIKDVKKLIKGKNILIESDGGINDITKSKVKDSDIIVSGSYILKSEDYQTSINLLRKNGCKK